ncbi:MAG: ABC transporter permease [Paracoccus sp. (in: a-proteobacteria)]|uniref:ABC transporter permease n=1 Tax=Paracoccus sp. TaxID=267 RepID=UPI0039E25D77
MTKVVIDDKRRLFGRVKLAIPVIVGARIRKPTVIIATIWVAAMVFAAVFADFLAPLDPNKQNLLALYKPPLTSGHLLGTDNLGRDVLSRMLHGATVSLSAALIGTGTAALIGIPLGLLAAFFRSYADLTLNFLTDAIMTVPSLILALGIVAVLGPGLANAMIAIGIVVSPSFYRLARASTLDVRNQTYIEATISLGASTPRTILRHVLPNILTPLVVQTAIVAGICIMAEASLSYLGLGVQSPQASWGSMLSNAARDLQRGSYLIYIPGFAIIATVLALGAIGNWLRDVVANRGDGK